MRYYISTDRESGNASRATLTLNSSRCLLKFWVANVCVLKCSDNRSVQAFCNVAVARRTVAGVLLAAVVMYNYALWTTKVFVVRVNNSTENWCTAYKQYEALLKVISQCLCDVGGGELAERGVVEREKEGETKAERERQREKIEKK